LTYKLLYLVSSAGDIIQSSNAVGWSSRRETEGVANTDRDRCSNGKQTRGLPGRRRNKDDPQFKGVSGQRRESSGGGA